MDFTVRAILLTLLALLACTSLVSADCNFDDQSTCLVGINATMQYQACHDLLCACDFENNPKCTQHFCEGGPMTVAGRGCPNSVLAQFFFRPATCCEMNNEDDRQACMTQFSESNGTGCQNYNDAPSFAIPSISKLVSVFAAIGAVALFV